MTRDEFIGKLQMVYVGDKHASADIISEYDSIINLNKQLVEECQRLDNEETRLNNILDELEKVFIACDYQHLQRKLKALKEE